MSFIDFDRDIEAGDEDVADMTGAVTALLRERPCTSLCEAEDVVVVKFVVADRVGVDGADEVGDLKRDKSQERVLNVNMINELTSD